MFVADSRRLVRLPRFPSHCSCPLSVSLLVSQRKPKESKALFLRNVVFTSNNTAVQTSSPSCTGNVHLPYTRVRMFMNKSRIFPPSRRGRSKIRNLTFLIVANRPGIRLEIIMPVFFAIILFFNSHMLLLLFLHISAIILKFCSKKSQFSNTYNECNY